MYVSISLKKLIRIDRICVPSQGLTIGFTGFELLGFSDGHQQSADTAAL